MLTYPTETQARDQAETYRRQGYLPTVRRLNSEWAVNRGRYLGESAAGSFESGLNIEEREHGKTRVGIAEVRTKRVAGREERAEEEATRSGEALKGLLESRKYGEETSYSGRTVQAARGISDILSPAAIQYYKSEAEEQRVSIPYNNMINFIDFYARLSDPSIGASKEEKDKYAAELAEKLDAESNRLDMWARHAVNQLEEMDVDQEYKDEVMAEVEAQRNLSSALSNLSSQLKNPDRAERVIAIDLLVQQAHLHNPTIIPQIYGAEPHRFFQVPILKVFDYLAMADKEKGEFQKKVGQAPRYYVHGAAVPGQEEII